MIEIAGTRYELGDPILTAALIGAGLVALVLVLLLMAVIRSGRSARNLEAVAASVSRLNLDIQTLGSGQQQLSGAVNSVSEASATGQMRLLQTVEARMADVQQHMNDRLADNAARSTRALTEMQERMKESLHGSSEKTTQGLTQLQERLAVIDRAQDNITKLSGDVLSLQDILSNKQTRGAFGEIQLTDIVSKALPSDSYSLQATLSNGKRADCLINLPNPPGPIVIDAKFPLEAYEVFAKADTKPEQEAAIKTLGAAVRVHIRAISEKYIIEGETADGALMFLPSEAVYAELHARLPQIVREGFAARVWIVSPTTCMATLHTMRAILKDARLREQTGAIRKELGLLGGDVDRLGKRVQNLDRHFGQASKDLEEIKISAEKAGKRANRLDNFDFAELDADAPAAVLPSGGS